MKFKIPGIVLFLLACSNGLFGETALKDVSLKGELRFRNIYYQSESDAPPWLEGAGLKEVNYSDMFFRNRLNVRVSPNILVGSVLDVYSVFGEGKAKISSPDLGLQARNVFAEIKLFDRGKLTAGYTTFSLPDGLILATNGAGIKYEHSLFNDLWIPRFDWLKAYDNSRNNANGGIGLSNYKDNDIFILGGKLNPPGNLVKLDMFYVYDRDRETAVDPLQDLHWAGIASKFFFNHTSLDVSAIYNNGLTWINGAPEAISSMLFRLSLHYEKPLERGKLKFSWVMEGASGQPGAGYRRDQFMSINPSYGLNNISIDNTAGVSLFRGGDFAGIANLTLIAEYSVDEWGVKFIYSHLRLFNQVLAPENGFGNEGDVNLQYDFNKNIVTTIQTGMFFPDAAYEMVSKNRAQKPLLEIIVGISIKY